MNMNMPVANAPTPSGGGSKPIYQIWIDALTKPNENTFAEIAASPNAKATTAYLWVFVGYLVEFFLSALVSGGRYSSMLSQYGGSGVGSGIVGTLVTAVCGGPILAVIFTIFFAIWILIIQWIAKMFGGQGTNDQLAYAIAAIGAPFSMISGVISLFSAIPYVGYCFTALLFIAVLYVIVLNVMAVKGVNQFGWGQAIGTVLIPAVVIGLVCGCLAAITAIALGSAIGNVFNSINQSLVP
jgi:uncharacterized protein YggT (Ycf19 family)